MTAIECMQHEWITGTLSPNTLISLENDVEDIPESEDNVRGADESSAISCDDNIETTGQIDIHGKVKNEISEMSVTEE